MIVVCEGCQRRFQVDDARIPAKGARVRCKRCHHRFRVFPPNGAEAEPEDTSVSSTTGDPGASRDEQTLLGRSVPEELRFVTEEPAEEASPPPTPEAAAASEEAWEFADSELSADTELASTDEAVGGATAEALAGDGETTLGERYGVDPEHTMDPSAPIEDDPDAIERPPPGSGPDPNIFDLNATGGTPELAGDPQGSTPLHGAGPGEIDPTEAQSEEEGGGPEIGSAADWDRLAGETPGPESVSSFGEEAGDADGGTGFDPESILDDDDEEDLNFELDLPAVVDEGSAGARSAWLEHAGWALSLVLLLAVARGSVRIEPVSPEVPPGHVEVAGLAARNVRGHFVENARSGHLFVVSGELTNPGSTPRRAGRTLQVVLIDASGRPLARPPALIGTALPTSSMREMPVGVLALQDELRARSLVARALAPGESVPFHAVLSEVSEDAVRFRIEAGPEDRRFPAPASPAPERPLPESGETAPLG